jgi:ribosome-associated protein
MIQAMEDEFVSRTKKKQHVEELQRLGAALVDLPAEQVAALALPEALEKAVLEARRISSHGALRRQIQYIGKVMRGVDPVPIRAALDVLEGRSAAARAQQQKLEDWRARLIGDDAALTAFAGEVPGADLQAVRTLIRNARREIAENKPPRAQRELFRLLRDVLPA